MYYLLGSIYTFTILSEIVCVYILTSRGEKNLKTYLFSSCLISSMLWGISQVGIFAAANEIQFYNSYIVGNIGVCFIGTCWLNFILCFIEKLKKTILYITFGISALFYLSMLTNPLHHLYYTVLEMGNKQHALLFQINKAYIYICVVVGMIMLLRSKAETKYQKNSKYSILSFVSIPFLLNLLQHFKIVNTEAELTPLSFCITCIFIFIAIFKYDFLNINKLVFEEIIRDINEGVVVFSGVGRLSYINNFARQYLEQVSDLESFCGNFDEVDLRELKNKEEVTVVKDSKFIQIQKIITCDKANKVVSVSFLLKDVSKFYQLIEQNAQISRLEQELLLEQERNDIIQKVHDTTGHTLTMIQSLLKLGINAIDERNEAEDYLVQAKNLAANSIRELREYINNTKENSTNETIHSSIFSLVETVKEIPIEVKFTGRDEKRYVHLKETIYLCIKELITNCLRYANASSMQIIIKFLEESVEIFVFDDGIGCDKIKFGNGLLGIKERITKAKGEFRVNSAKEEGFQTFISLPVLQIDDSSIDCG